MVETSKHTPGPWVIPVANIFRVFALDESGNAHRCIVADTTPESVKYGRDELGWGDPATMSDEECDRLGAEGAANARLIAAAPDLLAACEAVDEMLDGLPMFTPGIDMLALDSMRAAIAKAKGGH